MFNVCFLPKKMQQLFKQHSAEWKLENSRIQTAVNLAEKDNVTVGAIAEDKLRLFLYAKGMLDGKSRVELVAEFDDILNPQSKD